jgi:hypothetical protein
MAILQADIQYRLSVGSGGAANVNPLVAWGGAKSSADFSALTTLFANVAAAEALAGTTDYRCIYVHNNHGSLTYIDPKIWIPTNTPSADTVITIGLGSSALNGTEQNTAGLTTAPTGITFVSAVDFANGVSLGDIPAGQHRAVWVKRVVWASAASASDNFTLRVQGGTAP